MNKFFNEDFVWVMQGFFAFALIVCTVLCFISIGVSFFESRLDSDYKKGIVSREEYVRIKYGGRQPCKVELVH